jgi:hypothetical protein
MASAKYAHLARLSPASEILPSLVMYTCHLSVMLSLCKPQMTTQSLLKVNKCLEEKCDIQIIDGKY